MRDSNLAANPTGSARSEVERREMTHALLELFAQKSSGREYFDALVRVIRSWTGCECVGLRIANQDGEIPYCATVGFDEEFLKLEGHLSLKRHRCFCIRAISQEHSEADRPLRTPCGSLRCDDTPGFLRELSPEQKPHYRGTCVKWGFASIAVIPVRHRDRILGAIHLADRSPGKLPLGTVEFLESLTSVIGEAIQRFHAEEELSRYKDHLEELVGLRTRELEAINERLRRAETSLQRERDELEANVRERTAALSEANRALKAEIAQRQKAEKDHRQLLRRLGEAQENERGRISRELHDQLGQELTALKLGLRLVRNESRDCPAIKENVVKLENLADRLMQETHRLAWELHPASLDDLGLVAALRRHIAEWSERCGVTVDYQASGSDDTRLPLELETALYRVAQEALTNVSRHARARRVRVTLDRGPECVSMMVEDDGAGFEAAKVYETGGKGRLGLLGMRERVAQAGGWFQIDSSPGRGTTLTVRLPLTDDILPSI